MSALLIDGKQVAADMREDIRRQTLELKERGLTPGLGVLLVGDDPASRSYVTAKEKALDAAGMFSLERTLPADASRDDILREVDAMNDDDRVHGILVQLPLPDSSIEQDVIARIRPDKDVDGFHPESAGRLMLGLPTFIPCTPHGILHLLKRSNIPTEGAHAVIVGRSHLVGRPLANLLSQKSELGNATVTLCHTRTKDIGAHTRQADIVIVAAGRPHTLTADMIREGAAIIDVGVNRVEDASRKRGYRLVGDVDFEAVSEKAGWITPVPGGVGPMTITMLLYNTLESARRRIH